MNIRTLCLMLLLGSPFFATQAQETSSKGVWTLEEAVNYAVENNLTIQRAALNAEQSDAALLQSQINLAPTLNAQASHNYQFGRNADPTTNTFINQQIRTNNFGVQASVPLFNGFANRTSIKAQKSELDASKADIETARNDTRLSVAANYLNILLAKELLQRAQYQVANSQEQTERTRRLVDAGAAPEANLLELESQLATDELSVINAQNQLDLAELQLQQLLQLPVSDNFNVVTPELDDLLATDQIELSLPTAVYLEAVNTQPQIKAADLRVEGALWNLKVAKGQYYPRLSLNGSLFSGFSSARVRTLTSSSEPSSPNLIYIQTRDEGYLPVPASLFESGSSGSGGVEQVPFWEQINSNFNQSVGLSLTIPILNNWQARTNVANANINARRAQITAQETRNQLRQTIEQAYNDARAAAKRYAASQRQITALRENARVAEQRFNVGALNALDYSLSRNNLNNAESNLLEAKYDYIFKKKVLDFYEGKPIKL